MLRDNLPTNAEEFKKIQDAILSKEISVVNTSKRKMYFSLSRNYEVIIIKRKKVFVYIGVKSKIIFFFLKTHSGTYWY